MLDTHLLIWAASQPDRLSPVALDLIEDPENDPIFSAASLWEITIKHYLAGRISPPIQDCFDGSCARTDTRKSG